MEIWKRVAEARVAIDQARLLTLYAAYKMDTMGNMAALTEISAIKVVAPSVLEKSSRYGNLQIHGGAGVSRVHAIDRILCSSTFTTLGRWAK